MPCHAMPNHTTSHHITLHHTTSHHIRPTSHHTLPHPPTTHTIPYTAQHTPYHTTVHPHHPHHTTVYPPHTPLHHATTHHSKIPNPTNNKPNPPYPISIPILFHHTYFHRARHIPVWFLSLSLYNLYHFLSALGLSHVLVSAYHRSTTHIFTNTPLTPF